LGLPPLPIGGGSTPSITGSAQVMRSTVLGNTTTLVDTGTLSGAGDAREASLVVSGAGEALHASTIGWPDQVASEASIANLATSVAGVTISADFVMARARDLSGAAGSGVSSIDNLSINGVPIYVTGEPNQVLWIAGGQVILNEVQTSSAGSTVNAVHVILTGVADVVIASASAGIP
jgi:hypothetical protein